MPKQEQKQRGYGRSRQTPREKSEFESKLVDLSRVTRVSAGGRRFRFRAVVVAGDRKSRVGVGTAKGADVAQAVEKATRQATKNLVNIPIVKETIPHEVEARFGASKILLKPQRTGRGLVAGGVVRIIAELGGIKNISAKTISKSRNKLNNARATLEGFRRLEHPAEPAVLKTELANKEAREDNKEEQKA